jgi:hypothetical protein
MSVQRNDWLPSIADPAPYAYPRWDEVLKIDDFIRLIPVQGRQ